MSGVAHGHLVSFLIMGLKRHLIVNVESVLLVRVNYSTSALNLLFVFLVEWSESVTLSEDMYYKHLVEGGFLHISASCYVPKYDSRGRTRPAQTVHIGKEFKFEKPTVHVTVSI